MDSDWFTKEKPWAILGITRRKYERARPWKAASAAKMTKETFANLVRCPAVKSLQDEAQAEILAAALFGDDAIQEGQ